MLRGNPVGSPIARDSGELRDEAKRLSTPEGIGVGVGVAVAVGVELELRAVIDYATAAKIAFANDFAFLLHGRRAAHRAPDRILHAIDLYCFGLFLAQLVQFFDLYGRHR
jgi:hypothetical protein